MEIYIYTLSDENNNVKYVGQTNNISSVLTGRRLTAGNFI
jgi:hypothetical protein